MHLAYIIPLTISRHTQLWDLDVLSEIFKTIDCERDDEYVGTINTYFTKKSSPILAAEIIF